MNYYKTYDEWNEAGFYIKKGSKGMFKKGKFMFSWEQVEAKTGFYYDGTTYTGRKGYNTQGPDSMDFDLGLCGQI